MANLMLVLAVNIGPTLDATCDLMIEGLCCIFDRCFVHSSLCEPIVCAERKYNTIRDDMCQMA